VTPTATQSILVPDCSTNTNISMPACRAST
jgi:hypothetical protein